NRLLESVGMNPDVTGPERRLSSCTRTVSPNSAGHSNRYGCIYDLTLVVHNVGRADRYCVSLDDRTERLYVLFQYNNATIAKVLFHYCCMVTTSRDSFC